MAHFANASASSSISTTAPSNTNRRYDVFLNYRGVDVKKTFASHLCRRLRLQGFQVFLDQEEMTLGECLTSQITGAIATASVNIAIFSPRYAESKWCLQELVEMLESTARVIPVFYHVRPSELRWTRDDSGYGQALRKLEEKKRHDPNTIKIWKRALSDAAAISGFDLEACNGDEGELLDRVVKWVEEHVRKNPLDVVTHRTGLNENLEDFEKVVELKQQRAKHPTGLDDKVKDFESKVFLQQSQIGKPCVAGIVGLAGVGKTTLAKEFFNRNRSDYNISCFLSDVSGNARKWSLISLQKKLLQSLTGSDLQVKSIDEGKWALKKHLSSSHALIILDDVDEVHHFDAFVPDKSILRRSDSLILITSRNENVLRRLGVESLSIYKLTGLNEQHSRELFCWYAFTYPHPLQGFEDLVDNFLEACDGLPLSLEVFGALLHGTDENYWENQLDGFERSLPLEIRDRFQTSYNSLSVDEQHIFLDIACFFIGEDRDKATMIWDASGWEGLSGFVSLQDKSLVEVDCENSIRMHNHLRDFGRDLAKDPGLLLRIWSPHNLFLENTFDQIRVVRGISMIQTSNQSLEGSAELLDEQRNNLIDLILSDDQIIIEGLQLLRTEGDCLESISNLLTRSKLVWLCWNKYPYSSLPVWIPKKKLRVLEVAGGELETLWQNENEAPLLLRELNIGASLLRVPKSIGLLKYLEKIEMEDTIEPLPEEFFNLPSLKHLRLRTRMKQLPPSLGNLTKLQYIDLSGCTNLQTLPPSLGNLASLEHVKLNGCFRLEMLPDSLGNLNRLSHLSLAGCSNLTISSTTFGNITTIESLDLSSCPKMEALPPQVTHQWHLEELNLKHTNLRELPAAISYLSNLKTLKLQCPLLEVLPHSLGDLTSLKELTLHFCNRLKCLPDSVGALRQLTTLTIHYAAVEYLPVGLMDLHNLEILKVRICPLIEVPFASVGEDSRRSGLLALKHLDLQGTRITKLSFPEGVCPNLQYLNISFCHELVEVGALPTTLISLDSQECSALEKIRGLSDLAKLQLLDI